jgi:catechol 2,3-dioxygenase-like lactoylglutathione lyase family enzyme
MLDHVTLGVSDLARSRGFYARALAPLGIEERVAGGDFAGFGVPGRAFFWIGFRDSVMSGAHVAFVAADRGVVDAFYAAALAAGGRDNGAPGARPQYHADYYGAFVLDPDGHNIEAVCRRAVG